MIKTYIGDGIYAELRNGELILTTENGICTTNRIVFGAREWESLLHWMKTVLPYDTTKEER